MQVGSFGKLDFIPARYADTIVLPEDLIVPGFLRKQDNKVVWIKEEGRREQEED
jgi:hypothetical protein